MTIWQIILVISLEIVAKDYDSNYYKDCNNQEQYRRALYIKSEYKKTGELTPVFYYHQLITIKPASVKNAAHIPPYINVAGISWSLSFKCIK